MVYLANREGAPKDLRPSYSVYPLLDAAGFEDWHATRPKLAKFHMPYWRRYFAMDPTLAWWAESDRAFRAPLNWPVKLALPAHVTPVRFGDNMTPQFKVRGAYSNLQKSHVEYTVDQWAVLAAWAHGWPVPQEEWPAMQRAAEHLMTYLPFVLWAYDLDPSMLPLPSSERAWSTRLTARYLADRDPLRLGPTHTELVLPEVVRTPEALLRALPRRSDGVGPSTRITNIVRPPGS